MKRATPTTYERSITNDLQDPRVLDQLTRAKYNMSAAQTELAIRSLMAVSKGEMPAANEMAFISQTTRQLYGWSPDRTRSELRTAIAKSSPQERIGAYLSANGHKQMSQQDFQREYQHALELIPQAIKADLTADLGNRLDAGQSNNSPRDQFGGMKASDNAISSTRDQLDIRSKLNSMMGANKPQNYYEKASAVARARLELADRIEANAERNARDNTEPSLRESLRDNYDIKVVSDASEDIGYSNPIEDANETFEREQGHLDSSYDVTESLRD